MASQTTDTPTIDDEKTASDDLPEITGSLGRTPTERLLYTLAPWMYPIYSRLFRNRTRYVSRFEERLKQANITIAAEIYLSGLLGIGVLVGIGIGGLLSGAFLLIGNLPQLGAGFVPDTIQPLVDIWLTVRLPVLALIGGIVGIVLGVCAAFTGGYVHSEAKIRQRRREINLLLPDATAFLYAQSTGGVDQLDLIKALANSKDIYGEVGVEAERIQSRMEYLNEDYRSAVEHIANVTPSEPLSQFYSDMLSVINSGGSMTQFLAAQKDTMISAREQAQQRRIEGIELASQIYIVLAVAPLFGLILFMIMSLLNDPQPGILKAIVYGLIPLLNLFFIALLSTLKQDNVGGGRLTLESDTINNGSSEGLLDLGAIDNWASEHGSETPILSRIRRNALRHRISTLLANPLSVFAKSPSTTFWITVPTAGLMTILLYVTGTIGPTSSLFLNSPLRNTWEAFIAAPVQQTAGWILFPALVVLGPYTLFHEIRSRENRKITSSLTEDLRKITNENDAGATVLESLATAGETSRSKLGDDLQVAVQKVNYGASLSTALIQLNNKYCKPRLARSIKLIQRSQQASNRISDVLQTATKINESEDELQREYKSRIYQQIGILFITFVVFIGVLMFLRVWLVPVLAELTKGAASDRLIGDGLSVEVINLLYFHAAILQGVMTGLVVGYMTAGSIRKGLKWAMGFVTFALVAWGLSGVFL